ncbi:hypothetical protein HMPREF9072_00988 [Capnocytophaga sp. oral taxon 324 str. F0483]|nr:hypothetical protein HMPREF9072_00988 [Capnocytophaga sp. oral taxon 324 str. F0483]
MKKCGKEKSLLYLCTRKKSYTVIPCSVFPFLGENGEKNS